MSHPAAELPPHHRSRFQRADAVPAMPPAEVHDAIATSAGVYEDLRASGRRVHFASDAVTGGLTIQVLDPDGDLLETLSPRQLLDLAAGAPTE
jgi:hypothetical protein